MEALKITNGDIILEFIYLLSALFFVVGLKNAQQSGFSQKGQPVGSFRNAYGHDSHHGSSQEC